MVETFMTIFLVPFTVFKYAFSIAVWYFGIAFLINSDTWYNMADNFKDLWR